MAVAISKRLPSITSLNRISASAVSLAQLVLQSELLDLARQRVAPPPEPRRRFHPVTAGVHERATNERPLELVLQPVADVALAAGERLRDLAIERLLPAVFDACAIVRGGMTQLGRQVRDVDPLSGRHD